MVAQADLAHRRVLLLHQAHHAAIGQVLFVRGRIHQQIVVILSTRGCGGALWNGCHKVVARQVEALDLGALRVDIHDAGKHVEIARNHVHHLLECLGLARILGALARVCEVPLGAHVCPVALEDGVELHVALARAFGWLGRWQVHRGEAELEIGTLGIRHKDLQRRIVEQDAGRDSCRLPSVHLFNGERRLDKRDVALPVASGL